LVVYGETTLTTGTDERDAALTMVQWFLAKPDSTLGADNG
jgi:hypothetical protein